MRDDVFPGPMTAGLTKRELFAAMLMCAQVSADGHTKTMETIQSHPEFYRVVPNDHVPLVNKHIARSALAMADALLAELAK